MLCLISALVLLGAPAAAAPAKKNTSGLRKIVVLSLTNAGTKLTKEQREVYADSIRGQLTRTLSSRYRIINNENLEEVMRENGKTAEDLCNADCAVAMGRAVSADLVISGGFTLLTGGRLNLTLKLNDTTTNSPINSVEGDIESENDPAKIKELVLRLAADLVAPLAQTNVTEEATTGELLLIADPGDSSYEIDDAIRGTLLPGKNNVLTLGLGKHRLLVRHSGFQDYRAEIFIEASRPLTERVTLLTPPRQAQAAAGKAILTIDSNPPQARIFLDGRDTGRMTPANFPDTAAGTHEIVLQREFYLDFRQQVTVADGDIKTVAPELTPNFGSLQVSSEPAGATIFLDGEQRPEPTPFKFERLEAKAHRVRLTAPRYDPLEETVVVAPGGAATLSRKLKPVWGDVTIESEPDGARVEIDGVQQSGVTPLSMQLNGGMHQLRLTRPRFHPLDRALVIEAGKKQTIHEKLKESFGNLQVTATANGEPVTNAEVWVQASKVGLAGAPIEGVQEGNVSVEVRAPLHETWSGQIRITPGAVTPLKVKLKPQYGMVAATADQPAQLVVDGEKLGPANGASYRVRMGSRRLVLEPDNGARYRPAEKVAVVEIGKTISFNEKLTARKGKLVVLSTPPGAKIFIDGQEQGASSPTRMELFAGDYSLTLKKEKFLDWTGTATVIEGQEKSLDAALKTVDLLKYEANQRAAHRSRGTWLAVGAGAAALGSAVGIGLAHSYASSEQSAMDRYRQASSPDAIAAARNDVNSAKSSASSTQTLGFALGAGAATLLGLAIWQFATSP